MKRINIFIIVFTATVILFAIGVLLTTNKSSEQVTEKSSITNKAEAERQRTEITYKATAGETSLNQLKREADGVITKTSEFGEYVDTIEGHQGGTDGQYWSFYIDGTMSSVGADSYTQKGGETITKKKKKL